MRCLQMVSLTLTPVIKWLRLHCLKEEKKRKEDNWKKLPLMLEILDVHQILAVPPMNLTLKINRRQICLMTFPEFQGIRSWIIDLFILVCGCTWHPFGRRHFQWTRLTAIKLASVKLINIVKVITNRRVWALVPNKLVEPGNAIAWGGGGLHGNPASGPPPGTVILNNSPSPCLKREGGMGKPKHKLLCERQAIAITWQELRARNCVRQPWGAPKSDIGPLVV